MKYTIMGFSQKRAVELGLSVEDLAILRWFVDFYNTDHMRKFQTEGKEYVLVSYQHFLDDMPIFTCTKKTLATKFKHLVDAGVLEYRLIKDCGTFSVYRIGPEYESLICRLEQDGNNSTPLPENQQPGYPKIGNPVTEKSVTKDPSTIYPSTRYNNTPIVPQGGEREKLSERFERFWEHYPRKTGKGAAEKSFVKYKPSEELTKQMIDAVEALKSSEQWQKESGRFIPLPATWLNQKRWEDEILQSNGGNDEDNWEGIPKL
jgi:hypothetical protein